MADFAPKGQVQAWALNRYYYQAMIPIKDANLLSRCHDSELRRNWRSRLVDHDGETMGADARADAQEGGIQRWLRLTSGLGLDPDYVISECGLLPTTRYAVDAYVHFVREKTLLEAVASCLTELFSPEIISERLDGMLRNYDFVSTDTLAYFVKRPPQATRDFRFCTGLCEEERQDARGAGRCPSALEFKCDVLWAMLDALHHAYVEPKHIPPGAFVPKD